MKQNLPVSYLLFTPRGRINRITFLNLQIFIWLSFYVLFNLLDFSIGYTSTLMLYPILFWALYCTAAKRLHDSNKTSKLLVLTLIPILGPLWLFLILVFKKGSANQNRYGTAPGIKEDYHVNPDGIKIEHLNTEQRIINDVTALNPIIVNEVKKPTSILDLQDIVKQSKTSISIGGGRFSMGGQTASVDSLHIDMRALNKIEDFSKENKTITVQSGIRWCDIQNHIDEHDLSVKIMQSYANFTVGGSLSVNAHGRYIGLGPVILSVLKIEVLLADGSIKMATKNDNSELFYGAIGGYNALGIITKVTLQLADNVKMKLVTKKLPISDFIPYFNKEVRHDPNAIMHNTDIYPPHYTSTKAATWVKTDEKVTTKTRLMPLREAYPIERYFLWAFSETPFGMWRREKLIEPLVYLKKRVHWRNYEAGYDVTELEPKSRIETTYVLREYFVPFDEFDNFSSLMAEIFKRHRVNVINISIRHATPDPGTYLAWAKTEMFAFVVYYKQRTRDNAKSRVAVWTREMIDAVLSVEGTYYLPYQIHATQKQFHKAYPKASELFKLKEKYDPNNIFRNKLWDTYYKPESTNMNTSQTSEFHSVFNQTESSDDMYRFLQIIFHLYPEDRFHQLITDAVKDKSTDKEIYETVQAKLPSIKAFLSAFTYALPALKVQKKEITKQTLEILQDTKLINGYLEIGSTGRYISDLRKHIKVTGPIYLQNDIAPAYGPGDFFERGQLKKIGTFFNLDYNPITENQIKSNSLDVVTCYIGLHHCPKEKLDAYLFSIHRILKPGGKFIIRDHDCATEQMITFASLVHTIFNLGLNEKWEFNTAEYRNFQSINYWCKCVEKIGFTDSKQRILQDKDPSLNTLVCFIKQ